MMDAKNNRQQAVLLLGPTGAGKSPLGEWLETHGFHGRRCHHFDFGANLRAVAGGSFFEEFTLEQVRFIREVLERGALLENETFYLAEKILSAFKDRHAVQADDLLVLNGLPRHMGQAADVDRLVDIFLVVHLDFTAEVVRESILIKIGVDRTTRTDDTDALLQKKLATFNARTQALLGYYRERGVRVQRIDVGVRTQAAEIAERLPQI